MKTLSEKEFNEFNAKGLFTDRAEQAKKALFPVMQEVRKFIPGAEYGYRVIGGQYPEFTVFKSSSHKTASVSFEQDTQRKQIQDCPRYGTLYERQSLRHREDNQPI